MKNRVQMNRKGVIAFAIFISVCAVPYIVLRYFNIIGSAFFALIVPTGYAVAYFSRSFKPLLSKDYRNALLSFFVALLFLSIAVRIEYSYYNFFITALLCLSAFIYLFRKGIAQAKATVLFLLICLQVIFLSIPDKYFYALFWKGKMWSEHITWASYKKTPPSDDDNNYDASTDSYISYKINYAYNYPQAMVMAFMHEDSSWTRYDSPLLLIHEQGHFNMNEIYARKAMDSINSHYPRDPFEVWKIIDYFITECEKQQDIYDEETNHNRNQVAQKAWTAKLEEELKHE